MRLNEWMLSVCAWHLSSGERVEHLAKERLPSASLIKVPIALAVLRAGDQGLLRLDEELRSDTVPPVGGAGVLNQLSRPRRWPVGDLLRLMIVVSDNLATNLLLDLLDRATGSAYDAVAQACRLSGLTDTVLRRRMMDPAAVAAGRDNWTTAADQCRLMGMLTGSDIEQVLTAGSAATLRTALLAQQLSSGLGDAVPPDLQLGHKTGSLTGILHDSGFLLSPTGTPVVAIAVLTRSGPGQRAAARAAMTDAARDALAHLGVPARTD